MSKNTDTAAAAKLLSVDEDEIKAVSDSPDGQLITTSDGVTYINVDDDKPDPDGKSGLMYYVAPTPTYKGSFPVFTRLPGDAAPEGVALSEQGETRADRDDFDWAGAGVDDITGHAGDDPIRLATAVGFESIKPAKEQRKGVTALAEHLKKVLAGSES